jgi:transposase
VTKKQNLISAIKVIGVDLAKTTVSVHAVDEKGKAVLRKKMSPAALLRWLANVPSCLVGLEACGGAHHTARELQRLGHTVRLMAPQFVKPYVKSHKSDALDAEAICEAVQRPNMRFVAVKTREQQDLLSLHRARALAVTQRTALCNQVRGLLLEMGIGLPQRRYNVRGALPQLVEDDRLTVDFQWMLRELHQDLIRLDERVAAFDARIGAFLQDSEAGQRLKQIPGIGPLGSSALLATIGDARVFRNGRQCAAWLGLVPHQHSTGGKTRLLGISKRGDSYVRWILVHGARAVLAAAQRRNKSDALSRWVLAVAQRRGKNRAIVALANKLARIAWALLAHDGNYQLRAAA